MMAVRVEERGPEWELIMMAVRVEERGSGN